MNTALTIAGSDSSGGAGIQADIKTMTMNGVYAMSAVTALTAQNTTGVTGIFEVTPEFLGQQIDAVFTDIFPDAVKIGMVSSSALIRKIAESLRRYEAKNIVVDPVMVSTSGAKLIADEAVKTLAEELMPLAVVATPNIPEAEILSGMKISTRDDMMKAGEKINAEYGCSVLVKGGHSVNDADDLLCEGAGKFTWFKGKRIETSNTHGTGCTLSSAIAANLAKGYTLADSVRLAKEYISGALGAMLDLGKGSGPMKHSFNLTGKFAERRNLRAFLTDSVSDIWPEYNNHPFVKGIETGTLDREKFKRYIIQDYHYLNEYSKVFALGIAKTKSLETAKLFTSVIEAIANVEMNNHKGYMGRLGVTQEELDRAERELANQSYTSYMLKVAYEGGEAEILAAILSCALSYEDIAKEMVKNNPASVNDEFYGTWVSIYSGKEYCSLNNVLLSFFEKACEGYGESEMKRLAEIFRTCSLYEMGFWDMGWSE